MDRPSWAKSPKVGSDGLRTPQKQRYRIPETGDAKRKQTLAQKNNRKHKQSKVVSTTKKQQKERGKITKQKAKKSKNKTMKTAFFRIRTHAHSHESFTTSSISKTKLPTKQTNGTRDVTQSAKPQTTIGNLASANRSRLATAANYNQRPQ